MIHPIWKSYTVQPKNGEKICISMSSQLVPIRGTVEYSWCYGWIVKDSYGNTHKPLYGFTMWCTQQEYEANTWYFESTPKSNKQPGDNMSQHGPLDNLKWTKFKDKKPQLGQRYWQWSHDARNESEYDDCYYNGAPTNDEDMWYPYERPQPPNEYKELDKLIESTCYGVHQMPRVLKAIVDKIKEIDKRSRE